MFLIVLLVFIASATYFIYVLSKRKFDYWKKKNVPYIKPLTLFGNFRDYILLRGYIGTTAQNICKRFLDRPYVGAYYGTEPALIVQDPELIKLVLTKDFYYFNSREIAKYTHNEVFTQNLFFTYGNRWKVLRQNLTPIFSSARMRNMFHLIDNCCRALEKMLDKETKSNKDFGARSAMIRYTMDCIGSCAFGVNTKTIESKENNVFTKMGYMLFEISNYRGFKTVARAIWPSIFYGLGFKSFPTEVNEFFHKLLIGVFEGRNNKPSTRNDFVDLVLNFKNKNYISGDSLNNMKTGGSEKFNLKVEDELLVAQCVMFFAAGFETSATTLGFVLYELAKHEEIQARAFEEVDKFLQKHNGSLVYDCVTELPYLDACVDEALRLYPVLGVLTREVVSEYTLPDGLKLDKGVRVHIPVYHLHKDPRYFRNPEQFCPERFLGDEKRNIMSYTYMPFGEGPRTCIGMRFAKMQILPGLVTVLKKYHVRLAEGMPSEVEFEPKAIVTQSKCEIMLKLTKREGWEKRMFPQAAETQ